MKTATALSNKDWQEAINHLVETKGIYLSLIGKKQVNPYFGIAHLTQLENRYIHGERTLDLYIAMMTAE